MDPERDANDDILPFRGAAPTASPPNQRFSLERLSSAFARLMGAPATSSPKAAVTKPQIALEPDEAPEEDDSLPVTPRMIVEGMLFVGNAEGKSLPAEKIASHIRNVSADEVDQIVGELNVAYRQDETAYEIVGDSAGYRLQLRSDLGILRDQFRGQQRAAKLTPAAIEVLSIVAYRQGVSGEELNKLRGSQSHAILAQLVRRHLVRVERAKEGPRVARYHTTSRFNQLFGVSSPADLPRSEDLDDS
jgi:segregation and condensation protein B